MAKFPDPPSASQRSGGEIRIQLREGEIAHGATELDFYDFARCFGFSWLEKPYWK